MLTRVNGGVSWELPTEDGIGSSAEFSWSGANLVLSDGTNSTQVDISTVGMDGNGIYDGNGTIGSNTTVDMGVVICFGPHLEVILKLTELPVLLMRVKILWV